MLTAPEQLEAPDDAGGDADEVKRALAATLQLLRPDDDGAPPDWPPPAPPSNEVSPTTPASTLAPPSPASWPPLRRRRKRGDGGYPIELERATCDVCRDMATCAAFGGGASRVCFDCLVAGAQLIAHAQRPSARPHRRPCCCEACIRFDEGQRGEAVLLSRDPEPAAAIAAAAASSPVEGDAPTVEPGDELRPVSHFAWLEVD